MSVITGVFFVPGGAQLGEYGLSGHDGRGDLEQDKVGFFACGGGQAFLAIGGLEQNLIVRAQSPSDNDADGAAVVHTEDLEGYDVFARGLMGFEVHIQSEALGAAEK